MEGKTKIYFEEHADISLLSGKTVSVVGYGNQGRSQALNLRDSGVQVIIGNDNTQAHKHYRDRASADGFAVYSIPEASALGDILFLLLPDEELPALFSKDISPNLKPGACLVFASGYNIAFNLINVPEGIDVIMIAPRMIGVGVRETFLLGDGFFSFIAAHRDATGNAKGLLLACALGIGTLKKGAVETTMKQEAVLDLYNEQAFGPAFGRVLLTAINVLIRNGLPPEAVLIEMYVSGEMSYTYQKMAQVGLVDQVNFHSHTSQYGAMSRGIRYMNLPLQEKFQQTFDEIASGAFAREWEKPASKLKFKALKFFATKQKIRKIEKQVRKNLRLPEFDMSRAAEGLEAQLNTPGLRKEIDEMKQYFEAE
jgi:ketol-acid reductoisomerase